MSESARDPYVGILKEMRTQAEAAAPAGMCLGVVLAIGPGVLQVRTDAGLVLDAEDLWINPLLRYDAEEELTLEAPTEGEATLAVQRYVDCYITFSISGTQVTISSMKLYDLPGALTGTVKVKTRRLSVGDRVLLQPSADGQVYYLICKVARP